MSREKTPTRTSPYRGVSFHSRDGLWRMKITAGSRQLTWPTYFRKPETAARVFDVACQFIRGPDAVLTFDGEPPPEVPRAMVKQWLIEQSDRDEDDPEVFSIGGRVLYL